MQRFKAVDESLSTALRWHFADSPDSFPRTVDDDELMDRAGRFLLFAADHFLLSNMHSMYGHGLVRSIVTERPYGRARRFGRGGVGAALTQVRHLDGRANLANN